MMRRTRITLGAAGLGTLLFVASAIGVPQPSGGFRAGASTPVSAEPGATAAALRTSPGGAPLDELIGSLQARLDAVPGDHVAWSILGLAYVRNAAIAIDPSFYARAEQALVRSFHIRPDGNFLAHAGRSTLAAARHDFVLAEAEARLGLEINPYSALLHGALSDAELQLGRYDDAFATIRRMVDLVPDTASLTRASYAWELRGDVERAEALMSRALDDAPNADDRAFALVHLGQLRFDAGDPAAALERFRAALAASPDNPAALAGSARSLAAIGQPLTALDEYARLVARAPEPGYLLEYARLLESLGRDDDAAEQYEIFRVTQQLLADSGVAPDAELALHLAEHGDPAAAVEVAEAGLLRNPFITMHDAHAWALHHAGRHDEALIAVDRALELGTRSALIHFHAGMISRALGDHARARVELATALSINPHFDPLHAPVARQALAELGGTP